MAAAALTDEQRRTVARRKGVNPTYNDCTPEIIPGYHCNVRVYPSMNWAWEPRSRADQADYLAYQRGYRPGCAVFVDGELVEASWLANDPEKAAAIAARLKDGKDPCDARTRRRLLRFV